LKDFEGAAGLLWTKVKDNEFDKLYAFRNKERPLYRGIIKGEGALIENRGMYLSSIEDSLSAIGSSNAPSIVT